MEQPDTTPFASGQRVRDSRRHRARHHAVTSPGTSRASTSRQARRFTVAVHFTDGRQQARPAHEHYVNHRHRRRPNAAQCAREHDRALDVLPLPPTRSWNASTFSYFLDSSLIYQHPHIGGSPVDGVVKTATSINPSDGANEWSQPHRYRACNEKAAQIQNAVQRFHSTSSEVDH